MKILITGAGGFIGRNLVDKFGTREDIQVMGTTHKKVQLGIPSCVLDVLDEESIQRIFQRDRFDVVIHLAALTAHDQIVDNKYEALQLNLKGTRNILESFNKYSKGALFIYASTGKVYGNVKTYPINEEMRTSPTNTLGKSKLITERLIDFYAEEGNQYMITRVFNIYGDGQRENFVVPTIVKQLKTGRSLSLGNILDKRDYLHIDDLVNAILCCIDNHANFSKFDIVNIGSGIPVSVEDIVHCFEAELGYSIDINVEKKKMRYDEMSVEYCSNKKLMNLTGWNQSIPLQEGIHRVCIENELI